MLLIFLGIELRSSTELGQIQYFAAVFHDKSSDGDFRGRSKTPTFPGRLEYFGWFMFSTLEPKLHSIWKRYVAQSKCLMHV